jgi:hypothetical protein
VDEAEGGQRAQLILVAPGKGSFDQRLLKLIALFVGYPRLAARTTKSFLILG